MSCKTFLIFNIRGSYETQYFEFLVKIKPTFQLLKLKLFLNQWHLAALTGLDLQIGTKEKPCDSQNTKKNTHKAFTTGQLTLKYMPLPSSWQASRASPSKDQTDSKNAQWLT